MDHRQIYLLLAALLSQQIHHIHFHGRRYVTQHSNIVPKENQITKFTTSTSNLNISHKGNKQALDEKFPRHTWLKKRAKWAVSTASSISASSHMINGDFPPSSKVTGFRLLFAANSRTSFPVLVDPVKASCGKELANTN